MQLKPKNWKCFTISERSLDMCLFPFISEIFVRNCLFGLVGDLGYSNGGEH